jgi:signal transduction histidine kinase
MAIAAGITLHAAITYGAVGLARRPRDAVRIAFAVEALSVSAGAIAAVAMYSAATPAFHAAVTKWVFFPAGVVWVVATIWMVAFYADVRPTRWLVALSGVFCAVLLLNGLLPFGMLHGELDAIRSASVGGARLTVASAPSPHPLYAVTQALVTVGFAFMFVAVWRVHRRGESGKALRIGLAVLLFLLAVVFDTLADYGVVANLYLTQLTFVVVVLAVGTGLRQESIRAEAELLTDRTQLRSLVDERVRELDEANERLEMEVQERLATENSLRRRVAELNALQRISQALADRSELATALDHTTPEIAALFSARYARIDLAGGEVSCAGSDGRDCPHAVLGESGIGGGWSGVTERAEHRSPVAFDGPDWAGLPSDMRDRAASENVGHLLVAPLAARGVIVGALSIARDQGAPFSDEERRLAETVAEALAAAVENERLHERQTRQAAEEERQRLARDLHDAVTQTIYSAALIAEALPVVWEREPSVGLSNLVRLRRLVRAALAEMRTLLFELRPSALEDAPLEASLARLGDALAGQIQVPVDIRTADVTLPSEVKLTLYRVAQEAFSNIAKHSRATEVDVDVAADGDGSVTLCVRDNGRGFDPEGIGPDSMGLRIMRERLDRVGATLAIDTGLGAGTTITVVWPGRALAQPLAETGSNERYAQH